MWFVDKVPGCFADSVGTLARATVHEIPRDPTGNNSLCVNLGNFDFFGGDLVQIVTDSVGACCEKCFAENRCYRYSYREADGTCWLKTSYVDHSTPRAGFHSGLARRADQVQLPMVWEYGDRPCALRLPPTGSTLPHSVIACCCAILLPSYWMEGRDLWSGATLPTSHGRALAGEYGMPCRTGYRAGCDYFYCDEWDAVPYGIPSATPSTPDYGGAAS